ncbi:major ampullate spidroin 2, putative [Eimeria brunetti]|uniref:Major ampullate spidroin 2, putative n=1 Tax=Eimeria brunetti TaxID=51314 RepID=U6LU94_9EIME|nr:major ampullate spidroin 2, putative [Eimeria brunetti]
MGLSKTEYEDAVNLEKLYFLANSHDQCALCDRGVIRLTLQKKRSSCCAVLFSYDASAQGVSSVDLQRYEFLCNACSAGKTSAKKIGTDRFTAFEVQKLLNKFGDLYVICSLVLRAWRVSAAAIAAAARGTAAAAVPHGALRPEPPREDDATAEGILEGETHHLPPANPRTPAMYADSPPRASWASSRPRGSRGDKSSSRRKGAPQEDFVASGWPQPSSNVWGGVPDTGAPQGGMHQSTLPGMGGLAGVGMAAVPHAQQQPQQQQQQPNTLWRQGQTPQGLMTPNMQQMQMPQQGATIGSFMDTSQQQWRPCGGLQPQQHVQQLHSLPQMQPVQQPNNSLFGVQPQQPQQQQQPFGMGGSLGRPPQMMVQQQQQPQPNLMLQQHQQPNPMIQMQQLQQPQQQRNPFASMRGPQQPAARPSNPFASLQGSHFGGSPFQQQQQPQLQQPQLQQPQLQQPQLQQPQLQQAAAATANSGHTTGVPPPRSTAAGLAFWGSCGAPQRGPGGGRPFGRTGESPCRFDESFCVDEPSQVGFSSHKFT